MACPWELPFPLFPWLGSEVTGLELGWWSRQQPLTWRVETWNVHTEGLAGGRVCFFSWYQHCFYSSCFLVIQDHKAEEQQKASIWLWPKGWCPKIGILAWQPTAQEHIAAKRAAVRGWQKLIYRGGGQLPGLEQRCHWEWGISICGCHMLSFSCEGKELYLQGQGTRSADKLSFLWWCWHGCVLRVWCWSFRRIYIQVLSLKTSRQMESLLWLLLFHSILQSVTARGVRFGLV